MTDGREREAGDVDCRFNRSSYPEDCSCMVVGRMAVVLLRGHTPDHFHSYLHKHSH